MTTQNVADDPQSGNVNLSLEEKLARFGEHGIPLIVPWATKGTPVGPFKNYMFGYQKRTREDTLTPEYQHDLYCKTPHNVAMRQGGGMTRVVAFDVDTKDEAILEELLEANPKLRNTFWTQAAKGPTIWFKIKGPYLERKHTIVVQKDGVEHKIEWRGNGYSVIHGKHPDGMMYEVVNPAELVELEWSELTCPGPNYSKTWPQLFDKTKSRSIGPDGEPIYPVSSWQLKRRINYVENNYETLDWTDDYAKANVTCKNAESHTKDTGPGQTVIFTGADSKGIVSYHCSHAGCEELNKEETGNLIAGFIAAETFILHNQNKRFSQMITDFYGHLATLNCFFRRSESSPFSIQHWKSPMKEPMPLVPESFPTELGAENILFSQMTKKGLVETIAKKAQAETILCAGEAVVLPIAKATVKHPLLVKTDSGAVIMADQYCAELQTIILGQTDDLPVVSFQEGLAQLNWLLDYWLWKESSDRSRGLAELLTPALLYGGFIKRPIPAMLMMADELAAGKTQWHKTVAAIYRHELEPHAYTKISIGGLEERMQSALSDGEPFFFIDELDGSIKNTFVNAFITGGDEITVRTAYSRRVKVSAEKMIIMLAGVKSFVIEPQLASRTIPLRILKPATLDHYYTPEGTGLPEWVRLNQGVLLASIYAVIEEWARTGARLEAPDSRFPLWSQAVNGILSMLNLPWATKGVSDIQDEISNPAANWLPDFYELLLGSSLLYMGEGKAKKIQVPGLRWLCDNAGLEIPGVNPMLKDGIREANQSRVLGRIITNLHPARETNGRFPIFRLGESYLIQFKDKDRHGSMVASYVFSNTTTVPAETVNFCVEATL